MKIYKQGFAEKEQSREIGLINAFAKTELKEEEVYTFSVLLCDNEVDRDYERFTEKTLFELSELFVGVTGISDHNWSAGNQKSRIYRTEIVTDENVKTTTGEPYMYLKGYCYMLKSEANAEEIAEIEAGIRKETSIGCKIEKALCSICGNELGSPDCGHIKGSEYNGKLCYGELSEASDAYEWSFVAVPAQKKAGVLKKFEQKTENEAEKSFSDEALQKQAELGRKYLSSLEKEVLRLALLADRELYKVLSKKASRMEEETLLGLKNLFEKQLSTMYPPQSQLPGRNEITRFDDSDYIV
ncbi:hypothetical protein LJC01_02170 [Clostridiaceae bacterium OttesenSCG-928-D20]|nr:hypothetical protein [Clostridiaceae bacterium OttesenSCG-928-D20]